MEYREGNRLLLPWDPNGVGRPEEEALFIAWDRLHREDLFTTVFHDHPDMTLARYMHFFTRPGVSVQLLLDMADESVPELAGLGWLAEYEQIPTHSRALGSFVFFRKYQTPAWTVGFGIMGLRYYFEVLSLYQLIGVTPATNRAARIYNKRLGLKEVARIPEFCCLHGEAVDGIMTMMRRGEFDERYNKALTLETVGPYTKL